MSTMQKMMDQFTGERMVEVLMPIMRKHFPDFTEAYRRYLAAMDLLEASLNGSTPSAGEEMDAIAVQNTSTLGFSAILGVHANLAHFTDPSGQDFLDQEPEDYLQEKTARLLEDFAVAQAVRDRFYALLSPEQQDVYDDVTEYVCYLESALPKLAHFYGYLRGNALLGSVIPEYRPDPLHTGAYREMLESYFGTPLDMGI